MLDASRPPGRSEGWRSCKCRQCRRRRSRLHRAGTAAAFRCSFKLLGQTAEVSAVTSLSTTANDITLDVPSATEINEVQKYIAERPFISSCIGAVIVQWLADSGAKVTCLDESIFKLLEARILKTLQIPANLQLRAAGGDLLKIVGYYVIPIEIGDVVRPHEVLVIRNLAAKAILGVDFLGKYKALIDVNKSKVTFQDDICAIDQSVDPVFTTRRHTILPHSAGWVDCRTNGRGLGYAESEYLTVDAALLDLRKAKFKLFIHNPTDSPLTLRRGMYVGNFTNVEEASVMPIDALRRKTFTPRKMPEKTGKLIDACEINGSEVFKGELRDLLREYHDVISTSPTDLGFTDEVQHEIHLKSKEPVHVRQFRIPEEHLEFLNDHVTQLMARGCIEVSSSAYNAPIFCVKKPKGGLRVVQDFRALNEASYDDKYSIKEIQECIDTIGRMGSKVFSTLDLTSGFWQQSLHPDSRPYTAFSVPGRARYHWIRMPMGLKGSPSSFQRLMDLVMQDLQHTQCYIDDVLVHSESETTHIQHVKLCLHRLRCFNLKINLEKCAFGREEVPYLGHVLTKNGVKPSFEKLKAVEEFPEPTSVKQIREFHGLTNYFRSHIKNFSLLSGQITRLMRKDSEWKGGPLPEPAKRAFLTLKKRLCEGPMLAYPLKGRPFLVSVDAATGCEEHNGGLGAILSQMDENGVERVVAFASRALKPFEHNYTPYLLEMTAATWAIDHFHVYLWGRKFTLLTDHKPVEKMSRIHKKTMNRLQEQMNTYNFIVAYRKGSDNSAPDALSRNPVDALGVSTSCIQNLQREDKDINQIREFLTDQFLPANKEEAKTVIQMAAHCAVQDDVVYFVLRRKGVEPKLVLFVPQVMRQQLLHAHHTARFAGHSGVAKTVLRLTERYYWPGMTAQVADFVSRCLTCQRTKIGPAQHRQQPLQPPPVPDMPNERVHMDLMGTFKTSEQGNKFLLVITDAFSKYAVSTAIPNKEAKTVAKALHDHWICRFSVPKNLVSDRGREFCNQVIDEMCVLLGIDRRCTAAFHPQANSPAESFNRSFIKLVTQMIGEASTLDWEEHLPALMFTYNTQVHKATMHSPFYLTHLCHPNLPFFDFEAPRVHYGESWAVEAFHRMQAAFRLARENNVEANEAMKKRFDVKTSEQKYEVGDRVLINLPKSAAASRLKQKPVNLKFIAPWLAGFTVTEAVGPSTYRVKESPHRQAITLHASRIKLDRSQHAPSTTTTVTEQQPQQQQQQQQLPPTVQPSRPVTRSMTKHLNRTAVASLEQQLQGKKKTEELPLFYMVPETEPAPPVAAEQAAPAAPPSPPRLPPPARTTRQTGRAVRRISSLERLRSSAGDFLRNLAFDPHASRPLRPRAASHHAGILRSAAENNEHKK